MLNIIRNEAVNGIELYFDGKPAANILETLKASKLFRWHNVKKCWYAKESDTTRTIAESLRDGETFEEIQNDAQNARQTSKKALPSLWERCDVSDIPDHVRTLDTKTICAEVRKHLKERFPEVKISIRKRDYNAIIAYVEASPYARTLVEGNPNAAQYWERWEHWENSDELEAVLKYCESYLQSYNYDNSDPMTDYFDVNFYGRFEIGCHYEQTEATEAQRADVENFRTAKAAHEEAEEAEAVRRAQEYEKEREEAQRAAEIKRAEDTKKAAEIVAHIVVEDLPEEKQIAALDLFQAIEKASTIEEAQKSVEPLDKHGAARDIPTTDAIISRKIMFTRSDIFYNFCNMLLNDWDFLAGKGRTNWEDVRVPDSATFDKLNPEQFATVHTFSADCVGVYLNDVLQFVIDPQGYSYARLVFIPCSVYDPEKNELPATEYRAAFLEDSKRKKPFYFPDSIKDQINAAELQPGEAVTLLYIDGFALAVCTVCGSLQSVTPMAYAQYSDAACFEICPPRKLKSRSYIIHAGQRAAAFRGILPDVPESMKYTDIDGLLRQVNFIGEGANDFIVKAIEYYESLGYTPFLDTIAR